MRLVFTFGGFLKVLFSSMLFLFILNFSLFAQTESANTWQEKLRPMMSQILGDNMTRSILGEPPRKPVDPNLVEMPKIPEIKVSATSVETYQRKPDTVKLDLELEKKYFVGYIKEVYEATRKMAIPTEEISTYYNILNQGGTREGIYRSLVSDATYAGMENQEGFAVKSVSADLAVFIYEKYLNKKINRDNLKGMSVFSLKRIVTEKALDLMDAFGDDRIGLEKWYANFSADMAIKFPSKMNNKLRQSVSAQSHLLWSKKVPIQHIKSEVIIKTHMAFNSLI